jgi:hypothetical protein
VVVVGVTAYPATMTVTMRCLCGAREHIFVTRALAASWFQRSYVCDDCVPTLDSRQEIELAELERLQREPALGALADAL